MYGHKMVVGGRLYGADHEWLLDIKILFGNVVTVAVESKY